MTLVGYVTSMAIAAAIPDPRQMIAQCEIEAVHLYPQFEAGVSTDPKYLFYVQTCMEAHGFFWEATRKGCNSNARTAACYLPPSNSN
jgi:hypothetical protein